MQLPTLLIMKVWYLLCWLVWYLAIMKTMVTFAVQYELITPSVFVRDQNISWVCVVLAHVSVCHMSTVVTDPGRKGQNKNSSVTSNHHGLVISVFPNPGSYIFLPLSLVSWVFLFETLLKYCGLQSCSLYSCFRHLMSPHHQSYHEYDLYPSLSPISHPIPGSPLASTK